MADATHTLPLDTRLTLGLAGLLLPRSLREEWLLEWSAECWHSSMGANSPKLSRADLRTRASGAFADAWTLLKLKCGFKQRIVDGLEARSAPIYAAIVMLALVSCTTHGFARSRQILFGRSDSGQLVLIAVPQYFSGDSAAPATEAATWGRSHSLLETGRWTLQNVREGGRSERVLKLDPAAMSLFAGAPIAPQRDRVEPLEASAPAFVGVVARLRDGATIESAAAELAEIAREHRGWHAPDVVPIAEVYQWPIFPVGIALLAQLLVSLWPIRRFRPAARRWVIARNALCYATMILCWLEIMARAPLTESAGIPVNWNWAAYALPILAGLFATHYLIEDAFRRCPVCCRPWRAAVPLDVAERFLALPGETGCLCDEGHAAVMPSSAGI